MIESILGELADILEARTGIPAIGILETVDREITETLEDYRHANNSRLKLESEARRLTHLSGRLAYHRAQQLERDRIEALKIAKRLAGNVRQKRQQKTGTGYRARYAPDMSSLQGFSWLPFLSSNNPETTLDKCADAWIVASQYPCETGFRIASRAMSRNRNTRIGRYNGGFDRKTVVVSIDGMNLEQPVQTAEPDSRLEIARKIDPVLCSLLESGLRKRECAAVLGVAPSTITARIVAIRSLVASVQTAEAIALAMQSAD